MRKRIGVIKVTILLGVLALPNILAAQTINYTYDVLGRVTFVNDSVNGNRDYDYDAAGNRTRVDTGGASDDSNIPVAPVAPTGLTYSGPVSVGNIYDIKWKVSTSATTYQLTTISTNPTVEGPTKIYTVDASNIASMTPAGSTFTTAGATITALRPNKPISIKACSAIGCSTSANF